MGLLRWFRRGRWFQRYLLGVAGIDPAQLLGDLPACRRPRRPEVTERGAPARIEQQREPVAG